VARTLALHARGGDVSQFAMHDRNQLLKCFAIASLPGEQEAGDVLRVVQHVLIIPSLTL
jgi:hypothetical protein